MLELLIRILYFIFGVFIGAGIMYIFELIMDRKEDRE